MMSAYNNNDQYDETIHLFNRIKHDGLIKDEYTYCYALIAAGNILSLSQCQIIIDELNKTDSIKSSLYVQAAMIKMYARFYQFDKAMDIFNENVYRFKDVNDDIDGLFHLYSAIMDIYAKNGDIDKLLLLFNDLQNDERIKNLIPSVIYNIVLNGCSHSGLIDKALLLFEEMKTKFKYNENKIDIQCITSIIDCLGRRGTNLDLDKAENLYNIYIENNKNMKSKNKLAALSALLSSCRNDLQRAQRVFDKINMDQINKNPGLKSIVAAINVTMSNIHFVHKQVDKLNG